MFYFYFSPVVYVILKSQYNIISNSLISSKPRTAARVVDHELCDLQI